jgi:hypothetical protein
MRSESKSTHYMFLRNHTIDNCYNCLQLSVLVNQYSSSKSRFAAERRVLVTPPKVDFDKLAEMETSELSKLIREYIQENEELRRENAELYVTREQVIRDQELVCRENERLLRKLEDVNS